MKATAAETESGMPNADDREDAADQRERQVQEHQQRVADRAERHVEQARRSAASAIGTTIDEPPHGALLVLELAAVLQEVAGRQARLQPGELLLRLGHEAAQVPAADVDLGRHAAHALLAADLGRAFDAGDRRDLRQRDALARRRRTSRIRPSASRSARAFSGKRTTTANRRWPSTTCVASRAGDAPFRSAR